MPAERVYGGTSGGVGAAPKKKRAVKKKPVVVVNRRQVAPDYGQPDKVAPKAGRTGGTQTQTKAQTNAYRDAAIKRQQAVDAAAEKRAQAAALASKEAAWRARNAASVAKAEASDRAELACAAVLQLEDGAAEGHSFGSQGGLAGG